MDNMKNHMDKLLPGGLVDPDTQSSSMGSEDMSHNGARDKDLNVSRQETTVELKSSALESHIHNESTSTGENTKRRNEVTSTEENTTRDTSHNGAKDKDPNVSWQETTAELKSSALESQIHNESTSTGENTKRRNEVTSTEENTTRGYEVHNLVDAREDAGEPDEGTETEDVKVPGKRTTFTNAQLLALEKRFRKQSYLSNEDRAEMAEQLGLREVQIKNWFQNRRTRFKQKKMRDPAYTPEKMYELEHKQPYPYITGINPRYPEMAQQANNLDPNGTERTFAGASGLSIEGDQYENSQHTYPQHPRPQQLYFRQPYSRQPYPQQPYPQQRYSPQPYPQHPYLQQPYPQQQYPHPTAPSSGTGADVAFKGQWSGPQNMQGGTHKPNGSALGHDVPDGIGDFALHPQLSHPGVVKQAPLQLKPKFRYQQKLDSRHQMKIQSQTSHSNLQPDPGHGLRGQTQAPIQLPRQLQDNVDLANPAYPNQD